MSALVCKDCGMRYHTHCVGCHRSFAGDRAFDAHRRSGACVDVEGLRGWWLNRHGYWSNSRRDGRWAK